MDHRLIVRLGRISSFDGNISHVVEGSSSTLAAFEFNEDRYRSIRTPALTYVVGALCFMSKFYLHPSRKLKSYYKIIIFFFADCLIRNEIPKCTAVDCTGVIKPGM